ncbi:gliding motility-associated C-terminal domain-containing protein [Tellurirhabdus rosea]|uniref:gliding motility-associated C-terminal domain-containing protein n=1 Tax=Tellurirhabdus rosea TaxID=2674997 RepID=UPI0022577233|nr:gliding motility-associated C-terminal domain-containing protein [Tellurirhabdus rosea]
MKEKVYFLLGVLLTLTTASFAQKGRFQVRFTVKSVDCASAKTVIVVQVRSSHPDSTFLLGDANYRFTYNPLLIRNPQIVSQENFSNVAPASDSYYLAQNLMGSTAGPTRGQVSLNSVYAGTGTGARRVGTEWMNVACIGFDIVNAQAVTSNCFGLTWNTDVDFPVSGLDEVVLKNENGSFDYTSKEVASAGVFESLTLQPFARICAGIGMETSGEVQIPDGFSPNGDGSNDLFVIKNLGMLKAELQIFDRAGTVLYDSRDYQNDWSGQTARGLISPGTYFYTLKLSDGRKFSRSITIVR